MKKSANAFTDYYSQHNISPVSQDISDLGKHFRRRASLYNSLGITPLSVKGRNVIEFGPGSGHNALYTVSLSPSLYYFVDGNPTGLKRTKELLEQNRTEQNRTEQNRTEQNRTEQNIKFIFCESLFQEFNLSQKFDIVIAEGFLPCSNSPTDLLRKISSFCDTHGILIITCADSVSVLSDILRKALGLIISSDKKTLNDKVEFLKPFFSYHFNNLKGMSRPVEDWILDNVLHPFIGPLFSIPEAINAVDTSEAGFDVLGSSPRFIRDMRWYKDMTEARSGFNEAAIDSYWRNLHMFLDYKTDYIEGDRQRNKDLAWLCQSIYDATCKIDENADFKLISNIKENVNNITNLIWSTMPQTALVLADYEIALEQIMNGNKNPNCGRFAGFFGRGQQYLSFLRIIEYDVI